MNLWFISDTHFNHENIIKFAGRPFTSVEEMNETMVERWNKVVKPADKVIHVGDVLFSPQQKEKENRLILSRLNGQKHLLIGNHDYFSRNSHAMLGEFFDKIELWKVFKEFNFFAAHIPLKFQEFRDTHFQVHGHLHQKLEEDKRYINVCVEHTNYTPIHLDEVLKIIESRM